MRFAICLFFSFLVKFVSAQDLVLSPIGGSFCKPGVVGKSPSKGLQLRLRISYQTSISTPINDGVPNTQTLKRFQVTQFTLKLKAPIIYKPNFTLLVGFSHYREEYHVSKLQNNGGYNSFE